MQYHLNGFKPGNLQIPDAAREPQAIPLLRKLPEEVDVLIVGCGPAGLTLARQLADFASISTCIVDLKSGPMLFGQADGISCRTQEIMEAFNCSEILAKEMYHLHRNAFWEPDSTNPSHIKRAHKVKDARLGLSEFTHGVVNQSRLHDLLLDGMANSITHLIPDYNRQLVELNVDQSLSQDLAAYPITAHFKRTDNDDEETIKARYVVGCDGGRSSVRHELGIKMEGDSANKAWGVMDVLVTTDFPDIRVKSFIQSKHHGAVMIVPREGGYLVRLYVELDLLEQHQRAANLDLGVEDIIRQAQNILTPYQLDVKEVAWWSIYEVGQRIAERFDDTPVGNTQAIPRAFIAGDAGHTHSPKGGWGLNTSLPDTFNLGWKLAAVLQGQAQPKLLRTYADERRKVAHMLINADREMSALVATKPKAGAEQNKDGTLAIEKFIARQNGFIAGTSIGYDESYICTGFEHQHLATGFPIGQRFHSVVAERLVDGCPTHLGHLNKADGRWRLFIFSDAPMPTDNDSLFYQLIERLADSTQSPINKYTRKGEDIDAVIDICAVVQAQDIEIGDLPVLLHPAKGKYGLHDYEKVYVSTPEKDIYQQRGINKEQGAIVLVRPDQHIASILPLDGFSQLTAFFAEFLLEP